MNTTEPPSRAFTTTVAAIIILFCIVGLLGNILVILAIFNKKRLRTLPNSFIASMSLADIVYITCGAAPGAGAFMNRGWSSEHICAINQYVILGFCFISLLHMVCIAVSRFIHVVHYTSAAHTLNRRNVLLALLITWTLLPVFLIPYHFIVAGGPFYLQKAFRCVTLSDNSQVGITAFLYLVCFVLPSVIVVVCYVKIRTFVKKKKQQLSLHLRKSENKKKEQTIEPTFKVENCQNEKGAADEHSPSVASDAQDAKTAFSISNGTGIRPTPPFPETVACSTYDETVEKSLTNEVDAHSTKDHPYIPSQKTIDILDDNDISDTKPYNDIQNSENDGAHTSMSQYAGNDGNLHSNVTADTSMKQVSKEGCQISTNVGNNCVTFTEISNIKRSVNENAAKSDQAQERSNRLRISQCGLKAKSSRSIRIRRIRLIRRNPHFRSISDEELQLNRMMAVVFVIIWIGYIPYPLVRFLDKNDTTISGTVYIATTLLLYVAGCLNPIVYGVMHKRFRAAFIEMLTFKLISLSKIGIVLNDGTNSDTIDQNGSADLNMQIRSECP
ncbi:G-protein coupled receptor moody-like [Anneissia japonica]|uniref:G-protein coupled receptor moody-like n=1 Tax=Anneissia japonica TaxID=1529436 RepID=UPI0014257B1B|nr:G-protein coupled receptor moody-like [Anneissia japonica]XP_033113258.1 G-protein coupled receptor moody-like [Anneissia japonica]